jgi:hypothetical protein
LLHDRIDITSAMENAEDDREGFTGMIEEEIVSTD